MKIYLDNNLGVSKVDQEELTQDTYGYNILKVYIPNAVLAPYDTFTCYYGALLQNSRKVGWFAMEARTSSDADYEANYTLYKATIEQCVLSVEGKVYIGCQVILGNSGNATLIKKNTAVVQFNVRKSVAINNDILIIDPEQTNTDVLESYKNLLENALTTYATKADVNSKLDLKADKSDTYTKAQTDSKLDLKTNISSYIVVNWVDGAYIGRAENEDEHRVVSSSAWMYAIVDLPQAIKGKSIQSLFACMPPIKNTAGVDATSYFEDADGNIILKIGNYGTSESIISIPLNATKLYLSNRKVSSGSLTQVR